MPNQASFLSVCIKLQYERAERNIHGSALQIKQMLCSLGFAEVWLQQGVANENVFLNVFKLLCKDIQKQNILSELTTFRKLDTYCGFKSSHCLNKYLYVIHNKIFRIVLSRFRLSSHVLRIEQCRWERTKPPRSERVCLICKSGQIEDEYHMCLVCPEYNELREKFIPKCFFDPPVMYKFCQLMETENEFLLNQLSRFIYFAFQRRDKLLAD